VGLDYQDHVVVDPKFFRPPERVPLVANPAKARQRLGWEPRITFEELVREMVSADLQALEHTPEFPGAQLRP
jgi:GDPmannose 4,6-dehydratase